MNISEEQLKKMSADEIIAIALEDVKDLPRHERRRYEKELKENAKIAQTFNPAQQRFIEKLIEERSNVKVNQEMEKYNVMMDRCISAFLAMEYEYLSMDEIFRKEDIIAGLIVDDLKKFDERLKEYKGDIKMANKKLEKYEEQIRVACEELIESGVTQKSAIETLMDKFPTLSKSMVINAYKKVKEELKKNITVEVCKEQIKDLESLDDEELKEVAQAAAEYIFEEEQKEDVKEKEEIKEPEVKPVAKLKIKSMTVQGENGVYTVNDKGVDGNLGDGVISFADIESLNRYKQAEIEKINKITDEFEAVFAMMQ